MSRTRYDYVQLEQEFIRGKMSVRELARLHEIPQERVSSLHLQAKKKDGQGRTWYDKRAELADRSTNKTLTVLADREAQRRLREAEVVDHALELIDEAILSATQTAKLLVEVQQPDGASHFERKYRIGIRDVSTLIDRLNLLMGRAPAGNEEGINFGANVNVNVDGESELGISVLERLAGISRSRSGAAHARPVGGGSLPDAEGARPN
jgi:hypothetical protein